MKESITHPKVSIIIPTYNRACYIVETIQSVQNQTYKNWELIIVDDGSDDNTEELVAQLQDERIQFVKAGRIGIGGKIKNIGLAQASGELIAFIDSDDLWAKDKIEKQVDALLEYPDAGFCLTNGYNFRKLSEPVDFFYRQREGKRYDDIFISYFKSEVAAFTQALLFRKSCLHTVHRFKEENSFSDADFIIRLSLHFKAVILYEPLVYRRLHSENYINATWIKSYYEGVEIILAYKHHLPSKIAKNALFRLYINFGESHLKRRQIRAAVGKFFHAWRYRPNSIVPFKKSAKAFLQLFWPQSR